MSKLIVLYCVGAMLAQAEMLASALRKAGNRVLIRDAETWLQYKDAPDKADLAMVPPGERFDDLHAAFALASPSVHVIRDEPSDDMVAAAMAEVATPGEEVADAPASEPLPVGPTREELDAALLSLVPQNHPDADEVVETMQNYFGALFTVEDAAKVRELLAPPPPPAPPVAEPEVPTPEAPAEPVGEKPAEQPAADQAAEAAPAAAPKASRRSAK